jgi:hypothetical protein
MDYLDTGKQLRHNIIMLVGYVLVAVAITISALVLLYQAYGFGIGKNGAVIQNGLVFFSSHPNPAKIYVDGKLQSSQTNTRLTLPSNVYHVTLKRTGYHDWQRVVSLDGGGVEHFDYPFLFPTKLTTKPIGSAFDQAPGLMTQSPDQRWLLIGQPGSLVTFALYDLKNPTKVATALTLPDGILSKATSSESLQLAEWADDNQHVVLQHLYDGKSEFILLDRVNPEQSINLNSTLNVNPGKLTLNNKKYDQYYLYDATSGNLETASLKAPSPVSRLQQVLAYKSYGDDTILYVTSANAASGKVAVRLLVGSTTIDIRTLPRSANYLVDLTKYSNTMYVVAGASSEDKVYIYRDPSGQLQADPHHVAVPTQILRVTNPNYLSFSNNAQFIVAENGTQFSVYDIENKLRYNYTSTAPLDAPQSHAGWMDGDRLTYLSKGKLVVADYDNTNHQQLVTASSNYSPFFAPDYKYVYILAPSLNGQYSLNQMALLTTADL